MSIATSTWDKVTYKVSALECLYELVLTGILWKTTFVDNYEYFRLLDITINSNFFKYEKYINKNRSSASWTLPPRVSTVYYIFCKGSADRIIFGQS